MRGLTFPIAGIPIRIDPSFWIIMGLFGLQQASRSTAVPLGVSVAEWVLLVLVGILSHELGHAFAFRAFGRRPQVVIYALGGLTSAEGRLSPGKRLASTLAGPAVGLVIGGLVLLTVQLGLWDPASSPLQRQIYADLLFINLGWSILNLVPIHPLDGGQSLEALLQLIKVPRAEQISAGVSILAAGGGLVWSFGAGQLFLGLFCVFFIMANVRRLRALNDPSSMVDDPRAPEADGISPGLRRTIEQVDQALTHGRDDDAVEMLRQEYQLRPGPISGQAYAAVLARTRRPDELEELFRAEGERLGPVGLHTVASSLVAMGRYETALRAAETGWSTDQHNSWQHALAAAGAQAGLRDVDAAVRWLYTAADRGWTDRRRLESDPLFAEVRMDPRLADIVQRMGV